jgi:hypothetical protein
MHWIARLKIRASRNYPFGIDRRFRLVTKAGFVSDGPCVSQSRRYSAIVVGRRLKEHRTNRSSSWWMVPDDERLGAALGHSLVVYTNGVFSSLAKPS